MPHEGLEIRMVDPALEQSLADFFQILKNSGDEQYFHPHPLTEKEAHRLSHYSGNDLYYVIVQGPAVLGYGMLRGWDDGYDVPSLGIVTHPSTRGTGLGKMFMIFLHSAAKQKGAKKIRLKVYQENSRAVQLYKDLGYQFQEKEAGQWVGFLDL